ncbi:MAG: hypothetical protein N3F06_01745 [Nitrososphaerales archaeon]|nr:hypothetical protein [Nitrososphaerales archaeon]
MMDRVKESGIFKRNKTPLEVKVLAAMLCYAGLSYRKTAKLLGSLSYMAVQRAFIALNNLPKPERRYRRYVAVDETKTKLGKGQLFIWAVRDVDTKEILAYRASFTRSSLDVELLLKDVLRYCENKPLFLIDKGPWYQEAFKSLNLEYRHETIKA